ncbi:hypothetical protein AB4212_67955, partial [Streptomyces sp. 2MCAF27]
MPWADQDEIRSGNRSTKSVPELPYGVDFRLRFGHGKDRRHPTGGLELAYARLSTTKSRAQVPRATFHSSKWARKSCHSRLVGYAV